MSSERASLKAAYFLDPKNLTYYFYLQVISETWPLPGHFGYFFALEKVPRRPGAKARTN